VEIDGHQLPRRRGAVGPSHKQGEVRTMLVQIEIPDYSPERGIETEWEDDFII
jgi:hypothetical protein